MHDSCHLFKVEVFFFKEEVGVVRKSSLGAFLGCSCWLYLVTEGWLGMDQQFIGPLLTQP